MTNTSPKVSILVPIYNVEQYLCECLDSIINQTLKDIEIILLDDGSTDKCPQIVDEYALKDKRVKVVHKENSGYGATMNIGLKVATGEYIGIVESDDYITPEMYEEQYALATTNRLDVLKADFQLFYGNGLERTFVYQNIIDSQEYYNRVLTPLNDLNFGKYSSVLIWSGIYNRQFLLQNNIKFHETPGASFQDNGFFFQTLCWAKRMYVLNKPFYYLRRDNPCSSFYSKTKAFAMHREMMWIKNFLDNNKDLFPPEIYRLFWFKTFHNFMFQLHKIEFSQRLEFLQQFANDFRTPLFRGIISLPLFEEDDIKTICQLVANTEFFAENFNIAYPVKPKGFKAFLYHRKKTYHYIKFYILGICVWKIKR